MTLSSAAHQRAQQAVSKLSPDVQACIDACLSCLTACEHCATGCLGESDVNMMAECVRLDRDCADLCALTARLLLRESGLQRDACALCAQACEACAAECGHHDHEHCQICAATCHACAEACRRLAA